MYEKKIKEMLFQKIKELSKIDETIGDMFEEKNKKYGMKYSDELDNDPKWNELHGSKFQLEDEIQYLLIDTKYHPLILLTKDEISELEKIWWGTDKGLIGEEILWKSEQFDKYLDFELNKSRQEMKIRLGKLASLSLSSDIFIRTKGLYKQIVSCYVFGLYDACCVLCRAIAEQTAKRYIDFKELGNLLVGNKEKKKHTIYEILKKLSIERNILVLYSNISKKADKILHDKSTKTTEDDALNLITMLQKFVKEFPKCI